MMRTEGGGIGVLTRKTTAGGGWCKEEKVVLG
jgi:hypothetical protein